MLLVAIVFGCSFTANRAEAQALYYRSIPLGERAMGLGGAYTGIANDPSATYYNPAGIVTGGRFQLMGSLSSLVFTRRTIDDAFDAPNLNADFTSTRTTTIPSFVGTVVKLGRKRFGDHQWAVAYSTFEVGRESFGVGVSEIEAPASLDLRLNNTYKSRWYGISFAAHAAKKVAVGLSGFLADQGGRYDEDIGLASGGTPPESGRRVGGDSATSSTEIGVSAYHIVFRVGVLHRINPRWQMGYMVQPPGIPASQKGSVFRRTTAAVSGNDSYFLFDESDLSTKLPIPFELRTGFEFKANATTVLSVDASVTGPVRKQTLFDRPEQVADVRGDLGVYFANSTERRWTPNVAVGSEHMFGKVVVAGGQHLLSARRARYVDHLHARPSQHVWRLLLDRRRHERISPHAGHDRVLRKGRRLVLRARSQRAGERLRANEVYHFGARPVHRRRRFGGKQGREGRSGQVQEEEGQEERRGSRRRRERCRRPKRTRSGD
jgi:hypothetical protein